MKKKYSEMTYEEFLEENQNKILGYLLLPQVTTNPIILDTPYPPALLTEEALGELKDGLRDCMPLDSMIIDLWDWGVRFEECLSDDWYYEAVFGGTSSVDSCARELSEFFLEAYDEYDIDYNQSQNDLEFESLILSQAASFIHDWRKSVFTRYAQRRKNRS